MKIICIIFAVTALLGPVLFALNMSSQDSVQSFWEFYPLIISGLLLAIVFFFTATRIHKNQKRKS